MYIRKFDHLNMVGVRATKLELEEQRSVIKFLLLEGEKLCPIFSKVAEKFF